MRFRQLTPEEADQVFAEEAEEQWETESPQYETLTEAEEAEGPLPLVGPTEEEEGDDDEIIEVDDIFETTFHYTEVTAKGFKSS